MVVVCAFAGRLSFFPRWIGRDFAPAGDPFLCVAKERGKERRPGFPGRPLRERLPCAARIGRPARNSSAAPPQTAAPESPARYSAARRVRTGFQQTPSLYGKTGGCETLGFAFPLKANPCFSKRAVFAKSPFRPAEQRNGRRGSPARLFEPAGRVPRRPPGVSSAGQSFAQANDRGGGSPFLLTSLAKQRSESPAGANTRPIQRKTTESHPVKPPKARTRSLRHAPLYGNHGFPNEAGRLSCSSRLSREISTSTTTVAR